MLGNPGSICPEQPHFLTHGIFEVPQYKLDSIHAADFMPSFSGEACVIAITSLWVLWLVAVSFSTKNTCLHELWELLLLTLRVRWCGILPHWSLGVVRSKMNCGLSRV